MKFANRLEALRWMCNNIYKPVIFSDLQYSQSPRSVSINERGLMGGGWNTERFFSEHAHNFRTEDDKAEIDWDKVKGQRKPELTCSEDACQMIKEYHAQLMPILEGKFGK